MKYLPRSAISDLRKALSRHPVVLIAGPRQCGKTTLARKEFSDWTILDLERPRDMAVIAPDIEAFLDEHPRHLIIDEVQHLPALFTALRPIIDRDRRPGRFLLLGSASPDIIRGVSESLAGRIGFLELTPLTMAELTASRIKFDRWFHGGFPPLFSYRSFAARHDWLEHFVRTFIERDIPSLAPRLDPARMRLLWMMLAHLHGGLLNMSEIARALSISVHTVQHHLDILEGAFMIRRLAPYYANVGKRLTKSPKVYIRDTGILHFFADLREPKHLESWPRRGHSWEGLVIEEIIAEASRKFDHPRFYFWRTQAGAEVDLLIAVGRTIIPIEIKLGIAVSEKSTRGLKECMKDLKIKKGFVITSGGETLKIPGGITILPFQEIVEDVRVLLL